MSHQPEIIAENMPLGNTATRILVSIVFIPLILLSSYFGGLFFLVFIAAVGVAAFYEFSRMAENKDAFASFFVGLPAVLALITDAYFKYAGAEVITYMIVITLLLRELFRNKKSAILNLGSSLIGIFYIGFFARAIIDLREFFEVYLYGGLLIIAIFITIWVCDSAAFFVGTAVGRHKMFPRVSPKKSWEGAAAGFVFSTAAMIVMKYLFLNFLSLSDAVIIGVITGTIGQMGDLIESLIKRDAGVKDSSNLIPGHGGIFDRFDSLLAAAPAVYIYLFLFARPV